MIRWRIFTGLCRYLQAGLMDGRPAKPTHEISWERVIELSSYEFVTPALAWCVADRAEVPGGPRAFLAHLRAVNSRRNEHLLDALARVVETLNGIGIEPTLLKGAARLVDGSYPSLAIRFLGDIDVLVPAAEAGAAFAAMQRSGFVENRALPPLPKGHHHLPMLLDRLSGAGVELHTTVTKQVFERLVPTADFDARARRVPFRDGWVRIADPTDSIAHLIAHDFSHHRSTTRFQLKGLLDLAVISRHSPLAIDWPELERRFASAGHQSLLASYLWAARAFLGAVTSPAGKTPPSGTMKKVVLGIDPAGMRSHESTSYQLATSAMNHVAGSCWAVQLPPFVVRGDCEVNPTWSLLELFEDGKRMGPPHSPHEQIRANGRGAFSHWNHELYFSASDNRDPSRSGRSYRIRAPIFRASPGELHLRAARRVGTA